VIELRSFGRAASAALLLTVGITSPGCCRHPSDAELIGRFQDHREEFETLKTMITEDVKVYRIGPGYSWFEGAEGRAYPAQLGLTDERLAQYRGLMEKLGVLELRARPSLRPKAPEVIARDERDVWMLVSECYAHTPEKSTKQYYYSMHPMPPRAFVEDTDSRRAAGFVYHQIAENWYIAYVHS
jgi:hypothetical protein